MLASEAFHDLMGRPTSVEVLNPVRVAGVDTYTWSWDEHPDTKDVWLGAVHQTTDAAGAIDHTYAPEFFGQLGRQTSYSRSWDPTGVSMAFHYTSDWLGLNKSVTWPGGTVAKESYDNGVLASQSVILPTGEWAFVEHSYDSLGLVVGWSGSTDDNATAFDVDYVQSPTRRYSATLSGAANTWASWSRDPAGRLTRKDLPGTEGITYAYDHLQRVTRMVDGPLSTGNDLETYAYDAIGNPTSMMRYHAQGPESWSYDPAHFSEVAGRSDTVNDRYEAFEYDPITGRLLRDRTTDAAVSIDLRHFYDYDGLGRLVRRTEKDKIADTQHGHLIVYDGDNQAIYEQDNGPNPSAVHRFGGVRYDSVSGETSLSVLPMLHVSDGEFQWKFLDQDGHALAIYDTSGAELQYEVTGVYGARLDDFLYQRQPNAWNDKPWELDGLHGQEVNQTMGTVHRGIRHAMLWDGRWLQPEPLLGMGLTGTNVAGPNAYSGVYSAGNPLNLADVSGFSPSQENSHTGFEEDEDGDATVTTQEKRTREAAVAELIRGGSIERGQRERYTEEIGDDGAAIENFMRRDAYSVGVGALVGQVLRAAAGVDGMEDSIVALSEGEVVSALGHAAMAIPFVPTGASKGVVKSGSFSVLDWSGYPGGVAKPTGPFRLLQGAEYTTARKAANSANAKLRRADPAKYAGKQIHEIQPVKFGGSPTDPANKIALTPKEHAAYTTYWNRLMRDIQ